MQLGPFLLDEPVATGGMGVVWRASWRSAGEGAAALPVAVKVLSAQGVDDPGQQAAFRNEVQAIAALDHPAIVTVYDSGVLTDEVALPEGLLPGSPWLAMEWADAGTLAQRRGRSHWEVQRRVLRTVLEGLAYAHARGVLHRDLKPGNILLFGGNRRPKLTDFGLATGPWNTRRPGPGLYCADLPRPMAPAVSRRVETGDEEHFQWGTPAYMAPEQLQDREADQGPWTDLYALGCIAWALATGEPPFGGSVEDTVTAQLYAPPPPFNPTQPVPSHYEAWLRKLLRKHPQDRYLRAADAAMDLIELGDALSPQARRYRPSPRVSAPTLPRAERAQVPAGDMPARTEGLESSPAPPLPDTWRPTRTLSPRASMPGVGLGLWGLRELPVVGRNNERDQLWNALWQVLRRGQGRSVVITGEPGVGRRRLRRWLCQRAHELGCTQHVDLELPLRSHGVHPWQDLVVEALREATTRRAATLSIDGDTPTRELLALLDELHHPDSRLPVLCLLVGREDEASSPLGQELSRLDEVDWVQLSRLSLEELNELVGEPLGLAPSLMASLYEASGGHPGRALTLLETWRAAGEVRVAPEGFERP